MLRSLRFPGVCAIAFGLGILVCFLCVSRNVLSASRFLAYDGQRSEPLPDDLSNHRGLHIDSLDLGVIESGGKRTAVTWLRNSGTQSVVLQRVVTSCDCLSVQMAATDLAAGDTVPVRIDFDDSKDPGFTGSLSVEVHRIDNDGQRVPIGTIDLEICADARVRSLFVPSSFNPVPVPEEPY